MSTRRVLVVYGTRPEAIKLAPVIDELAATPQLETVVAVTGQHREMLDQVHEIFGVRPDVDLRLAREGNTLAHLTASAVEALDGVMSEVSPDAVLVQGDTTSTMTGALAAFYRQVPVVHLEAGMRTGDRYFPFPEEMNRLLVTRLADLHLCATEANQEALIAEGVSAADAPVIGNTVIDALARTVAADIPHTDPLLQQLDTDPRRMVLVTAHRRESWGEGMRRIAEALRRVAEDPTVVVVMTLHGNPALRESVLPVLADLDNVLLVEPVDYVGFVRLMRRAHVILTDSGGIQEEAPALGKPVLVLREETERVQVVAAGAARLVGTDPARIVSETRSLLDDPAAYAAMSRVGSLFGDARAAQRAAALIARMLGHDVGDVTPVSPGFRILEGDGTPVT